MMSSESSDFQHICKLREFEENALEVLILNTVDLGLRIFEAPVIILVFHFEDIADFSKVAAWIKSEKNVAWVLGKDVDFALGDEVDAATLNIERENTGIFFAVLETQGGCNLSDKFIISSEPKFWILENNRELLLKRLQEVIFDNSNFHIVW